MNHKAERSPVQFASDMPLLTEIGVSDLALAGYRNCYLQCALTADAWSDREAGSPKADKPYFEHSQEQTIWLVGWAKATKLAGEVAELGCISK
jgi:hypothetical protein